MAKQIRVRIHPDGRVEAETLGIKGAKCTEAIPLLERLLDAEVVESAYTAEFYQTEEVRMEERAEQKLEGGA